MPPPRLFIFAGLPGTGKTTLARLLARDWRAAYLRIDSVEQALRDEGVALSGPEGYVVAYRVAADNLRLGMSVVADSVNPIAITRRAWREVAAQVGVEFVEIEVACSDVPEHRRRVESRATDLAGLHLPTWHEVETRERDPWDSTPIVIDTAGQTEAESFAALRQMLEASTTQPLQRTATSRPRIVVVPYESRWPVEFERAAAEVLAALGPNLLGVYHIGSTSIPGIDAKPVIDILAEVADLHAIDQRTADMQGLGYEVMGEFGIAGRRYFRRDDPTGRRTHQIHTFVKGSPHVTRHLAFRDFLRAHPEFAKQYGDLKRRLAAAHPHDMAAYMDGKDAFIKEMETRAIEWCAWR